MPAAEIYALIAQRRGASSVRSLCRRLGVSSSGYYAWRKRVPSARERADRLLMFHIQSIFWASNGTYGARRMRLSLQALGFKCGLHRVERLMRLSGCKVKASVHVTKRSVRGTSAGYLDCAIEAA